MAPSRSRRARARSSSSRLDRRAVLDAAVELEDVGIVDDDGRVGLVEPGRPDVGARGLDPGQGEQAASAARSPRASSPCATERDEVRAEPPSANATSTSPSSSSSSSCTSAASDAPTASAAGRGEPAAVPRRAEQPAGSRAPEQAHVALRPGEGRDASTHAFRLRGLRRVRRRRARRRAAGRRSSSPSATGKVASERRSTASEGLGQAELGRDDAEPFLLAAGSRLTTVITTSSPSRFAYAIRSSLWVSSQRRLS